MTAKELIEKLKELPQELDVSITEGVHESPANSVYVTEGFFGPYILIDTEKPS